MRLSPKTAVKMIIAVLSDLDFMGLLCYGLYVASGVVRGVIISVADEPRDEGCDDFGEGNDGETDEGVENHLLSFLEFVGVAGRSSVRNATVDHKNDSD